MTREKLAAVLEEIALLLELKDENPFKVRAYRHGAETVRAFDGDIVALAAADGLHGVKGIGDAKFPLKFHIVEDATLNAFAMPGGNVVLHSGLLLAADTPEEVAATLREALQYVDADKLYPSTNCGMAPLSRQVARGKMNALRAGTEIVRQELAV